MESKALRQGLWAVTAPQSPPQLESVEGEKKADVAIIGGGYTGLSAALYLSQAGTDALVLEANEIGYGGAGRNVGLVNAGLWLMPDDILKILGPDYGERVITSLGGSPDLVYGLIKQHNIDCEALRSGTLHCAHSPGGFRALRQRESQWQRRGAPVRLLDSKEAVSWIGSESFHGALLDERAGTLQPLAYAFGLAKAAKKAGAHLYSGSPVTSMKKESGHWKLETPSGHVLAKAVIIAVHGYADYLFKENQKQLIPFNFFQFATAPLPEAILKTVLPGRQGAWDTAMVLSSYRLDQAGRLIVGSVGTLEGIAYPLHEHWAKRTIEKVFPQVGRVSLEHGWYGTIAMTTDHVPRFHILDKDVVMVSSYNGRGIGPGTLFGKLLAEFVQTGSQKEIPLPVTTPKNIFLRDSRGLFYETGARLTHLVQHRL